MNTCDSTGIDEEDDGELNQELEAIAVPNDPSNKLCKKIPLSNQPPYSERYRCLALVNHDKRFCEGMDEEKEKILSLCPLCITDRIINRHNTISNSSQPKKLAHTAPVLLPARDLRRNNTALIATTTVDNDINTAAIAGLSTIPQATATPAARGKATILYPVAQKRF